MLVRILRMYRSKGLSPSLVGFLRTNSQTLRFLCRRFVGWFYHKYCLYRSEGSRTGWKEEFNHDRILTAASAILGGTSGSGMAIWWVLDWGKGSSLCTSSLNVGFPWGGSDFGGNFALLLPRAIPESDTAKRPGNRENDCLGAEGGNLGIAPQ